MQSSQVCLELSCDCVADGCVFCAVMVDLCYNECVLFRGDLADAKVCPKCGENRLREGKSKTFRYLPLIPQLQKLYALEETAGWMRWAGAHTRESGKVRDVTESVGFDTFATGLGQFDDPRHVLLMFSGDGINPFKKSMYSCSPLLLWLFNLSPAIRVRSEMGIFVGACKGPGAPKKMNVYLELLVDDLLTLATGVRTWDAYGKEHFTMRGSLLMMVADYPAQTKLLSMVGSGTSKGCLKCEIEGSTRYSRCTLRCSVALFASDFVVTLCSCSVTAPGRRSCMAISGAVCTRTTRSAAIETLVLRKRALPLLCGWMIPFARRARWRLLLTKAPRLRRACGTRTRPPASKEPARCTGSNSLTAFCKFPWRSCTYWYAVSGCLLLDRF